jgi:DNA-binding LacI/PurR family transcriptional regulator
MAVTLRDVAAHAGVSPVVVSHVLHNKARAIRVSQPTAERVKKSAETLGYKCNVWARNFRTGNSMQIGVIHGLGFSRPSFSNGSRYFADLMEGLIDGAFEHDYAVTLCPTLLGNSPGAALADGRFDGLIWYSSLPNQEHQEMISGSTVPMVVLHSTSESIDGRWPTVLCDNEQGIQLALDHLMDLGHERIAFLTEFGWGIGESTLRLEAFKKLMSERGYRVEEGDILDLSKDNEAVHKWLASKPPHTALVCHNDGLAEFAMERAREAGIDVPGQLSVVGFDSTGYCNQLRPRLSSVNQPLVDVGRTGARELVSLIQGNSEAGRTVKLPCTFDVRESTKKLK